MFKNEQHIIKEWLEHYLKRGVDHFYLIDDSSTDNYIDIIQPYIDKGQITLFVAIDYPRVLGRQMGLYNKYILPRLKETKWLLMCDLDEFVWSPADINMYNLLSGICRNMAQIQVDHRLFGSNGHIQQPKEIVNSFTKRGKKENVGVLYKYFVNSDYEFTSLNTHHASFKDEKYLVSDKFMILSDNYFVTNHYCCQSKELWDKVKCVRGDSDAYLQRTTDDFAHWDLNEEDDFDLIEQNKKFS